MAMPKMFTQINERLDRIEETLQEIKVMVATQAAGEPPETGMDPAAVAASIDYDTYTAEEIIGRAGSLSDAERAALHEYEGRNKGRKTVLEALANA